MQGVCDGFVTLTFARKHHPLYSFPVLYSRPRPRGPISQLHLSAAVSYVLKTYLGSKRQTLPVHSSCGIQ